MSGRTSTGGRRGRKGKRGEKFRMAVTYTDQFLSLAAAVPVILIAFIISAVIGVVKRVEHDRKNRFHNYVVDVTGDNPPAELKRYLGAGFQKGYQDGEKACKKKMQIYEPGEIKEQQPENKKTEFHPEKGEER